MARVSKLRAALIETRALEPEPPKAILAGSERSVAAHRREGRHMVGDAREFDVLRNPSGWWWVEVDRTVPYGPFADSEDAYRSALAHLG